MKLRTDFTERNELSNYLREHFPQVVARSPEISEIRGGREAAEKLLQQIDPGK